MKKNIWSLVSDIATILSSFAVVVLVFMGKYQMALLLMAFIATASLQVIAKNLKVMNNKLSQKA